jgi:DUF4097 and DUF4098 domain-containing protein YvlB
MIRVGRYTSALLLLAAGVALLLDQTRGTEYLLEWIQYWPVLLIALGVEYLIAGVRVRDGKRRLKWDIGSMLLAVVIAAAVSFFFHGSALAQKWNLSFDGVFTFWENGESYEKPSEWVDLPENTEKLVVRNLNGDISLIAGTGNRVEIRPTVVLYNQSAAKAEKLVRESKVNVTVGGTLRIEPDGAEYSPFIFPQKARMNLVVVLPAGRALDVELDTTNGNIHSDGIAVKEIWQVRTANGDISGYNLNARIDAETHNGDVELRRIAGSVRIITSNGDIAAEDVEGDAFLKTNNGTVEAAGIRGNLEAETHNGDVGIAESNGSVKVKTYNGDIQASASFVGGDWQVDTRNGSIELELPADGDYTVDAKTGYGGGKTNIPGLQENDRGIEGKVGTGEHRIRLASNGDIDISARR